MKTINNQINSISLQLSTIHHKYEFMDYVELSLISNKKHDLPALEKEIFEKIYEARQAFFLGQMALFTSCPDYLIKSCGSESYLAIAEVYGLTATDMVINHD